MESSELLIFGKDEIQGRNLKTRFSGNGLHVIETNDRKKAFRLIKNQTPAAVIISSASSDMKDGLQSVRQIRRIDGTLPIFMISQYSSTDRVISAFRAGVNDYFHVPLQYTEVLKRIRRSLNGQAPQISKAAKNNGTACCNNRRMIGDSKPMQEIRNYLQKVAVTDSTVLLTGETGTGKELAADMIHRCSLRHAKPLISINCAALPETLVESELFGYDRGAFTGAQDTRQGKFEQAAGGSVFLDEIGDMSAFTQAKILRIIENKMIIRLGDKKNIPLEMRIIAATNKEPEHLISDGKFREDLYYRLNVVRVHLPSLRERKEDIPDLIAAAIARLNKQSGQDVQGLTDEALTCLMRYDWPGNVRELMNLLEAVFVVPPRNKIGLSNLPRQFQEKMKSKKTAAGDERNHIISALKSTKWNKAKAASRLNWSRMTLYRKIEKYNIVEKRNPPR